MRRMAKRVHHHGKNVVNHALAHHKTYLRGAVGFFGIFKLFSFLALSVVGYLTLSANIQTNNIQIMGNHIIYNEQDIVVFNIQDISDQTITHISFQMRLTSNNRYIDSYLFTDIEQTQKDIFTLERHGEDIWNFQEQDQERAKELIDTTPLLYIQLPPNQLTPENEYILNINYIPQNLQPDSVAPDWSQNGDLESATTGDDLQQPETIGDDLQQSATTGDNLQQSTLFESSRNEEEEIEIIKDNINTNKDNKLIKDAKVQKNIQLQSKDKKIKIQIPKNTTLKKNNGEDFDGTILQPQEIDIENIEFNPKEKILYAFEVGDPEQKIIFKKNDNTPQQIQIKVYLDETIFYSGQNVEIYYSQDKTEWTILGGQTVKKDENNIHYIEIRIDHMTAFLIGSTEGNFFLGNNKCDQEIEETTSENLTVYTCVEGAAAEIIEQMRFSNISIDDLNEKERMGFENGYQWDLEENSEGITTVYAEFSSTREEKVVVSDTLIVNKIIAGSTELGEGENIAPEGSLFIHNINRTIVSNIGTLNINTNGGSANIYVENTERDRILHGPILVTDNREAKRNSTGLPIGFLPIQTIEAGANNTAKLTLDNSIKFEISFQVQNPSFHGIPMYIYYSHDGTTRNSLNTICTVTEEGICTFETEHLSLFTVGNITRNNLEFVNQRFWDQNPNNTQIIDAFFGTGGNPSAYTFYRSSGCRPTTVTTRNPATRAAQTLSANTIYVLNSGNHIQTAAISIGGNCIGIVGSGNATIIKSGTFHLITSTTTRTGLIIDNLNINGSGLGSYGINLVSDRNISINNTKVYDNTSIGILINSGNNTLINNSQFHNNSSVGIYLYRGDSHIINNTQVYNNGDRGIYVRGDATIQNQRTTINNSQIYNNQSYGIDGTYAIGLIINNSQIYNNTSYGIYLSYSPDVRLHNIKSFNNNLGQVYSINNSSGWYRGENIAYPNPGFSNFSAGNYRSALGRNTGTLATGNLGYNCEFVTNPINGFGTGLYTTSTCTNIGRVTAWTSQPIVKYLYGNNMLSGNHVLRQIQPTIWVFFPPPVSTYIPILSDLPYHGHRFIGEYDDPSGRDINIPISFFTGETPANNTNIINGIYSGYFTTRAYIYEPNLYKLSRREQFPNQTTTYIPYDQNLILMYNFDNIHAIGDRSDLTKDLSLQNNRGTIIGATWTGDGKRNGAYYFDGSNDLIEIKKNISGTNKLTIAGRFYKHVHADRTNPVSFGRDKDRMEDGGNQLIYRFNGGTGLLASSTIVFESTELGTGKRVHLTLTADGTNVRTYINGILHKTLTQNGNLDTDGNIYLGARSNNSANRNGRIDEFRIYSGALSSGEILHLYNSNLEAKSDHREYTVNYTGAQSRIYGTYTYGFFPNLPLIDADTNTGTVTGYVVKYPSCTGSTIGRENNNFLEESFWNSNPTHCDIIIALYGSGTNGNDPTAYTKDWGGWSGQCNYQNMNIVYLTGGTDKLPSSLAGYTIYVLASGNYLQTSSITANTIDCFAIVGTTGNSNIYTTTNQTRNMYYDKTRYNILDKLMRDAESNGAGGSHARNTRNIEINTNEAFTFHDIEVQKGGFVGIRANAPFTDGIKYGNIHNSKIHNNTREGITLLYTTGCIISGTQVFNHNTNGITMSNSPFSLIDTSEIYNNGSVAGITIDNSPYTIIQNSQIYNTTGAAIRLTNENDHITFNNLQLFNNGYGIETNDINDKEYITLNNSQIYNNANDGLLLYRTNYFTINTTHIYNNSGNGLRFAGSNNNSGILNNVFSYNNGDVGANADAGTHTYYGTFTRFDNLGGNNIGFSPGNSSTYAYLGRTGGTTTGGCINCSRVSNPRTPSPGYNRLIDTATYPKCDRRGQDLAWTGSDTLSYRYGISLTGQKLPVFRSGATLTGSSLPYSGSQYVAEINKLTPDYSNTQCSCLGYSFRWDNDNFLYSGFRNNSPAPNYCDIIAALYGESVTGADSTAYTIDRDTTRTGQCNIENVEVVHVSDPSAALSPVDNTVYVLASGVYNRTASINMANCSALISSGTTELTKTSNISTTIIPSTYNVILDNIQFNGQGNAGYGIYIYGTSYNSTINNIETYRSTYGIYYEANIDNVSIKNHHIHNSKIYNNFDFGIFYYIFGIGAGSRRTIENISINNSQIYNNGNLGIYYANITTSNDNSTGQIRNTSINNSQIYNNNLYGIYYLNNSNTNSTRKAYIENNSINNSQIYNNNNAGIYYANTISGTGHMSGMVINNSYIFNNTTNEIGFNGTTMNPVKYYGNNYITGNVTRTNQTSRIITGSASDFPGLGRTDGEITREPFYDFDYITNPINSDDEYLLSRTGTLTGQKGRFTVFQTNNITSNYSFGSGTKLQIQPVLYSGTTLVTGGTFSGTQYIGSNLTKITGYLLGLPTNTTSSGLTISGNSIYTSLVNRYSIFGNILTPNIGTTLGANTGIFLVEGLDTNRIITQLRHDSNSYFATHFQNETKLEDACLSGRDNDYFVDETFRTQNPSDANIICALYGENTSDTTAYTQLRTGWDTTQCSGTWIDVVYTGILPGPTLANNTIYVLGSGSYNISSSIYMSNCSALISSGFAELKKTATIYSIQASSNHFIIDNIKFNGNGYGNAGLGIFGLAYNSTLNNIDIYKNLSTNGNGIYYHGSQNNTTLKYHNLHNSKIYNNNQYGIYYYTLPTAGNMRGVENMLIDNTQIYNNNNIGIYYNNNVTNSNTTGYINNNTINNSQIYNNNNIGIYYNNNVTNSNTTGYINNNTINNSQIYNNNNAGIYYANTISGTGHMSGMVINNSYIFNNTTNEIGFNGTTMNPVKYYGNNYITGNVTRTNQTSRIITGLASDFPGLGRTDGEITREPFYDFDYITNPINSDDEYLLSRTGTLTGQKGRFTVFQTNNITNNYSFGSGTKLQIQPVLYSGTTLVTGGLFDPTHYIGSKTKQITGSAEIDATSITGISNDPLVTKFSVFGDITAFKIGQTINTSTGIQFITGLTTNKIISQLRGNDYFATHFQQEKTPPIIYFTGTTPAEGSTGYFNNFRPEIEIIQTELMDVFTYTFNGITYPYYDSGLVLMMNFDKVSALNESDGMIMDFSQYANHGSGYGGVTRTGDGQRSGAYQFDGVNDYISIPNSGSFNNLQKFTISARMQLSKTGEQGIVLLPAGASWTTPYARIALRMSYSHPGKLEGFIQDGSNANNFVVSSQNIDPSTNRVHVAFSYDGTTEKLYINGIQDGSKNITTTITASTQPLYIGTELPSFGGFSGSIDEVRIYNRALSSGEIYQMRRSNLSKYDTDKRRFVDDRQCMVDGTYTYTGYVSNTFGLSDTTGRRSTISLTGYTPYAPTGYFIGSTGVSAAQLTLSGQFTGHFKFEDRKGTTGRYTTIQLPLTFTGNTYSTNKIENDGNNIRFMATGVDMLGGTNSGAVYINPAIATETGSLGTLHYIKRVDNRTGYYCPAGIYANKPHIYVDIPGRQNPDTYSGIIWIDYIIQ